MSALSVLQHTLGLDQYGQRQRDSDRNYFATHPGHAEIDPLVEQGLMIDCGEVKWCDGMHCYRATDAGRKYVQDNSPAPPKLTRSQKRYLEFLDADSGMRFGEWLRYAR